MGNATVDLKVDNEGQFNGSHGDWFVPLQDNNRYLSWSQLGLTQQDSGLIGNVGLGQRWVAGDWLLGYNTFTTLNWKRIPGAPDLARRRGANSCVCRPTTTSR